MKIVVEPSSAIALAPLLRPGEGSKLSLPLRAGNLSPKIGIILSGGNVELKW